MGIVIAILGVIVAAIALAVARDDRASYMRLARTIDADEKNVLATVERFNWRIARWDGRWTVDDERHESLLVAYRRACAVSNARADAARAETPDA